MLIIICSIIVAFLLGAIPTGYLITRKIAGIDIRTKGSGNIGSTNVKRVLGTKISIVTQSIDVLKGLVPMVLAMYLSRNVKLPVSDNIYFSIIALVTILGHDYTPFLKFNGGKGVNTTVGAFFLIAPIATLTGVAAYFILGLFIKVVSIRSMALGMVIPIMCLLTKLPLPIIISATMACGLMVYRHKDNLVRLVRKEEV